MFYGVFHHTTPMFEVKYVTVILALVCPTGLGSPARNLFDIGAMEP